jgi:hypothetical protein
MTKQRRPRKFTCPRCWAVSHNPSDVEQRYCGACHDWTGKRMVPEEYLPPLIDTLVELKERRVAEHPEAPDLQAIVHVFRGGRSAVASIGVGPGPMALRHAAQMASELLRPKMIAVCADAFVASFDAHSGAKQGDLSAAWERGEREQMAEAVICEVMTRDVEVHAVRTYALDRGQLVWDPKPGEYSKTVGPMTESMRAGWMGENAGKIDRIRAFCAATMPADLPLDREIDRAACRLIAEHGHLVVLFTTNEVWTPGDGEPHEFDAN